MRKLAFQIGEDVIEQVRPRPRWPRFLLVLLLLVGLGPLALDGATICVGHWKEYLGVSSDVRTPTLDRVHETLQELSAAAWGQVTPYFRALPWEPKVVIPGTAIVMGLAMMMLRR